MTSITPVPETVPALGFRQNLAQFSLLVLVTGLVVALRMSETLAKRNTTGGNR